MHFHFRKRLCLATLLLLMPGCYRRVSYTNGQGRSVEIKNIGFDTQIGKLHAETADGTVTIENASSQAGTAARAADALERAADVLRVGGVR